MEGNPSDLNSPLDGCIRQIGCVGGVPEEEGHGQGDEDENGGSRMDGIERPLIRPIQNAHDPADGEESFNPRGPDREGGPKLLSAELFITRWSIPVEGFQKKTS